MNGQNNFVIHKEVLPFLNISMYLNNKKLIRNLIIENTSDIDSGSIVIRISADLEFIKPFEFSVPYIPAESDLGIPLETLSINRDFLSKLSETEKSVITIEVLENDILSQVDTFAVEIHPIEFFGGFQVLPELIASYVTPNHPFVYQIKRKAIAILEKQGLITAFEGYQSQDVERVLQIISAIYSAIQSEEIAYSALPPSYEERGQRLRLLSTIQKEKFGNCIDLTLLFAACLEAVNLNPILILVEGHAFVGCWLHDDKFPEIINDDKSAITKRLSKGIREIVAFEATSVCLGTAMKFSDALASGESQLIQKEDFQLSVDIKRARTAFIRPLPLINESGEVILDQGELIKDAYSKSDKKFDIGTIYKDDLLEDNTGKTKQKIWERNLLDLSLRNNLLNLRMTRNMLQLVDVDISHFEDTLSEGKTFSIMPNQQAEVQRKYNYFSPPLHSSSPLFQLASEELKSNRLLTHYHQQDLDNILTYIHKNAKQSIEENGSSTLYLAVGLLKWYDRKTPDQPRFSPILLVPVELQRRSINSKFTLKSREEETMINITLVEFLRQEYELNLGALEQLPYDDKGVDVAKVMGLLRRSVMQMKGWDVEEQLVLGNFSFNKLILWKDIVSHSDDILKSEIVRSLVEGKLVFSSDKEGIEGVNIDGIESKSIALPIPADVSQMEAVLTASRGHSFILHGPPGTGKSQTITNIIADALFNGKRVLFVAAKKAALDVVHKRLEQIGLGAFSLELHSNRSRKSDVLEQLSKSLESNRLAKSADYIQESERLDTAKQAISKYVDVLHEIQPIGWSLYESITALQDFEEYSFGRNLIPQLILEKLNFKQWQEWTDWLPQFQSLAKIVVHPSENPLEDLRITQYSPSINESILSQSQFLIEIMSDLNKKQDAVVDAIKFPFSVNSKKDFLQFRQVVEVVGSLPDMPLELCRFLANKDNFDCFEEWINHYLHFQKAQLSILSEYNRSVLDLDLTSIELEWKQAKQRWLLGQWLQKNRIKKQVAIHKNTVIKSDLEIEKLFSENRQLKEVQRILQQNRFLEVTKSLKNLFKEDQTDIDQIKGRAHSFRNLAQHMRHWGAHALSQWMHVFNNLEYQYTGEVFFPNSKLCKDFLHQSEKFEKAEDDFEALVGITFEDELDWIDQAKGQLAEIQKHLPELKTWMNFVQVSNQGKSMHLQWLIDAYYNKSCDHDSLHAYFHYTVHRSIAEQVISKSETLSLFNVNLFESKIEQYKKIAIDFRNLTISELRSKLASNLPSTSIEAMQSSEIGILQRAIKNRGRGMSIRKLFDQVPNLLPRLAPCMLMSPISVAQYFDVDLNHFDLVIFDEASQLPTCEAISALARAKQAIIVGDPKQMPPTSFFNTIKLDEENMDVEDLESILDDCLSLSVPSKYLLRHYRSKHESLIAFSNVNFYENKLLTFPSADDLNRKVQFQHVKGFYDKGKTRTNVNEADAIIDYLRSHYNDPLRRKLSIGVVTFSQTQQNLVEDRLQELFMSDIKLEEYANESSEPLFVKNLENVQGDERDIILFSIGYAPDKDGKLSMNFGPLNRNGGWRRLNVAITRARNEMLVFATLKSDQIDLSRTSSEGVAGLKAFLNFAEKGHLMIRPEDILSNQSKKHLSKAISKKLIAKGLSVKCNVGTSNFKVDIAIVHPEKPQEYILGIVLDGHHYLNAQTTNDREMVMPSMLKSLGWNIHRLWTMDWYENSSKLVDGIIEKVEILQKYKGNIPTENDFQSKESNEINIDRSLSIDEEDYSEEIIIEENLLRTPYVSHKITPMSFANIETIYDDTYRDKIKKQVLETVEVESPISKAYLFKKILQVWNIGRSSSKLDNHLESIINELSINKVMHHQPFYWNSRQKEGLTHYRISESGKRNMEDIAPEEILVALEEVVIHNLSIEEEELLRYLSRTFGFAKVGKQIEVLLRYVIDMAISNGKVKRESGRILLSKKHID
ncbi:DUF3320 domain-containing protein [Belliella sp. R4-6]|uniref:DUF3320 domain-containing protein n=1 Tax=Belliella alkalica TaxID=1730871 RepID=A0ABS9V770_9BACT|nr:DUF3320 domain-containing protein [Belliella alkalica]MCH7412265.1 DUF3320 domain-containing protein [Belliella alkalica]